MGFIMSLGYKYDFLNQGTYNSFFQIYFVYIKQNLLGIYYVPGNIFL